MTIEDYLHALDVRLRELAGLIAASEVYREININLGIGFQKGKITFVDGSRFEFTEQLPVERRKFRLHYMNAQNELIVRWDSAPHHKGVATFPFHKHTPERVESHPATTALEAIELIVRLLRI